jgi:Flp pilus assembly protein TadD
LRNTVLSVSETLAEALERHRAGRLAEAQAMYNEILRRDPDNADALHMLGVAAAQGGQPEVALRHIARAISLNPVPPFYHNNLGNVLHELDRFSEALLCYQEALRLDPEYAEAHNNLANTLTQLGRRQEALAHHLEAVRLKPEFGAAYDSLGATLRAEGLYQEALACYEEALRLDPGDAEAHAGRATLWLLAGDYQRGWLEYEWRWKARGFADRAVEGPLWDGSPARGERILLHAEQGLGDTIQFIRYVPMVKESGATVVVQCQPRLAALVQMIPEIDEVIAAGSPLPYFDAHLPLLSLPRVFKTTLETAPRIVPYLKVPAEKVEEWRARLWHDGRPKVGLVWAGRPEYKNDPNRSLAQSDLALLAQVRSVRFFSLQRPARDDAGAWPEGFDIQNLEDASSEITDTAAAILNLDLVISVDTMVAHLAGALGTPVWTLLPFEADWRWLLNREDSPWYPTMRLFRQPAPGEWGPVIERVAEALQHVVCQ